MTVELDDLRAPLEIAFEQKVANIIKIGTKGVVLYATQNVSQTEDVSVREFKSALEISEVSDDIKSQIKSIFLGGVSKVILVQYKTTFESVIETVKNQKFNWLCCDIEADQADIATFAKENNIFAFVWCVAADNKNVVNFTNQAIILKGETISGVKYLPRLTGVAAGVPYSMSLSGVIFDEIDSVIMPETIGYGQFILENMEDGIRVVAPINSLITLTTNLTEDMKSIAYVEGMRRIETDIKDVFKTSYKGHYKNNYKYQMLFYSAILGYIKKLVALDILDSEYPNSISTDIESQRNAWLEIGKTEATGWSDEEVKKKTFKTTVFALLDIKILDAIEGLKLKVTLF